MHTGKNVHSCPHCNRFFAHKHVFDSHLRTHTGERPFSCTRCGRAFSDRSNCSSHQKKCRSGNDTQSQKITENLNTQTLSNNTQSVLTMELVKRFPEQRTETETASKFDPQIVSVKSMSELCDPEKTKSHCDTTSIFENNLNAFIKDEEQDDDLVIFLLMLCISTSKRVLCTPFAGQNRLSDAKTIFSITNRTK